MVGGIIMKATLDFRDDLIDKEVAEKLSKEVTSYIIEQVKNNMKTIEERARLAAWQIFEEIGFSNHSVKRISEIIAERITEQKAIDDELCKSGEASDGYHTFNELYDFRREYNAALVNSGVWKAHKSYRHHSGELCFGGGWFIVMIETPFGQISNHYENKYWDEFHCEEKEFADEWDGHTEKDVIERLKKCNVQNQ